MNQQPRASPVNDLADDDLAHIFQYLPPLYRLLASEVCKRWREISRLPWRDVVTIDLTAIHPRRVRAIIKQCPMLQNVIANDLVCSNELEVLSRTSLSTVKLYNGVHTLAERDGAEFDLFLAMFSGDLSNASWDELVLHQLYADVRIRQFRSCYGCSVVGTLPASLKRLQLSCGGVNLKFNGIFGEFRPTGFSVLNGLWHLSHLTCLILCSSSEVRLLESALCCGYIRELKALTGLVELCIGWPAEDGSWFDCNELDFDNVDVPKICFGFHKLEVLFLHNLHATWALAEYLAKLITEHPALRILALTGRFDDYFYDAVEDPVIPVRRLYPNGFGSAPLPRLYVFLGKEASESMTFTRSSSDALTIQPITENWPSFLEKEEIAPIFEGVWIAGQIKEGAKYGAKLCEPEVGGPATSVHIVDTD